MIRDSSAHSCQVNTGSRRHRERMAAFGLAWSETLPRGDGAPS